MLVIRVPRLLGLNYVIARLIDPASIPLHNPAIMHLRRFRELFELPEMRPLFCDLQGAMHLTLSDHPHEGKLSAAVLSVVRKAALVSPAAMHRFLAGRIIESGFLSPFLTYIGQKVS